MNFKPQLVSNLKITKHVTTQPSKGFLKKKMNWQTRDKARSV